MFSCEKADNICTTMCTILLHLPPTPKVITITVSKRQNSTLLKQKSAHFGDEICLFLVTSLCPLWQYLSAVINGC